MSKTNKIEFNKYKLRLFKSAYTRAKNAKKMIFEFEGNQFDMGYAKYMIDYLENKLA